MFEGKERNRDSDSSFGLHSPDTLVPGAAQEALQVFICIEVYTLTYMTYITKWHFSILATNIKFKCEVVFLTFLC